jgi:glycosyltransferase involved in cell wall biosynthesis
VIPAYNHAHFLPHTIRSIMAQTFTDWEAIIVDDGSTDDTAAVVAQCTDHRFRYIFQANQGLAAARNTGILAARGEYLAFLDADDEWDARFLARCVSIVQARKSSEFAGAYTSYVHIVENGTTLPQPGNAIIEPRELHGRTS